MSIADSVQSAIEQLACVKAWHTLHEVWAATGGKYTVEQVRTALMWLVVRGTVVRSREGGLYGRWCTGMRDPWYVTVDPLSYRTTA